MRLRLHLMDESGVAMIEATIGTIMLLFVTLGVMQMLLVFHASLAVHGAATRAAREYAVRESFSAADEVYQAQRNSSFRAIAWQPLECVPLTKTTQTAECTVRASVPAILPGSAVLGGGKLTGSWPIEEKGAYPRGGI